MPTLRIAAITVVSTVVAALVIPLGSAAPAIADPCSVPTGTSARSAAPALPVLHLPIGRKPAPIANATPEATQEARVSAAAETTPATAVNWIAGPDNRQDIYGRFGISGADLGILWDNGQTGDKKQTLIAFGDTFGNCGVPDQQWRNNTLFRTSDAKLSDGLAIPNPSPGNTYAGSPVTKAAPNFSRQIIASLRLAATEVTVIPTAAIAVGTTQYINFMSVSQWGAPGQWSTNFSAVAVSTDNGETWTVPQTSIRPSWFNTVPGVAFVWGDQNFQMGAYVRSGGYVYMYGTTAGRGGAPFLARVAENNLINKSAYEYYTPFGWLKNFPFLAVQVVVAPGSEMSVAWNDYLKKFVMLNTDVLANVVMRTADKPEGPWSQPTTLLTSAQMPGGIYAPFIHPWSSGRDLYFTLSLWSTYSTALMRYTLP